MQFHAVAQEYVEKKNDEATLSGFLDEISLVSSGDEVPDATFSGGYVTLMTLHTAKGLEYPVVFLTGLEEGTFPIERALFDPEEISEERRLAYVGITRAKNRLFLTRSLFRTMWGKSSCLPPSRFLDEIPDELLYKKDDTRSGFYNPHALGGAKKETPWWLKDENSDDDFLDNPFPDDDFPDDDFSGDDGDSNGSGGGEKPKKPKPNKPNNKSYLDKPWWAED
jgi:DNA helicase-2/ATP-dependent DNA helicase PcrA